MAAYVCQETNEGVEECLRTTEKTGNVNPKKAGRLCFWTFL